jgi:hypothetical protein
MRFTLDDMESAFTHETTIDLNIYLNILREEHFKVYRIDSIIYVNIDNIEDLRRLQMYLRSKLIIDFNKMKIIVMGRG